MASTRHTIDSAQIRGLRQSMTQNYLYIWVDTNIDEANSDYQNILEQLHNAVDQVITCKEPTHCIKCLEAMDNEKACVIISGDLNQDFVAQLQDMKRVHTIYIYSHNKVKNLQWTEALSKILGVFTDIKPICQSLRRAAYQSNHNAISMSFISKDTLSLATQSNQSNLDQLEPTFMYSVFFKEIILEIDDNDDKDNKKSINELVDYCLLQNISQTQLNKFRNEYQNQSPVCWYTRSDFLYNILNWALRTFDVEAMIKMGFFIRSLHRQLEALQKEQLNTYCNELIVYRGQMLSQHDFQHLLDIKGGLLSFNNFLSTSKEKEVAILFAESTTDQSTDIVGIIFTITIDLTQRSILGTPFASIDECSNFPQEEEILFSMHTVFHVGDIRQSVTNNRLWEVQLTLTNESDPQLSLLTKRMKEEIDGHGWYRMGKLMMKVGHFAKAEILYKELLKNASGDNDRSILYQRIGEAKYWQGQYEEAVLMCEKSLEIKDSAHFKDEPTSAKSYNSMGLAYCAMGNYSKALEFHKKAREIRENAPPSNLPSLAQTYNNMGLVYNLMGDNSRALELFENAHKIFERVLPSTHPELALSYNNIGAIYNAMGEYSKALEFLEKAHRIRQKSLPPNHPDLAMSYSHIGQVYNNMGDYSKALEFHEKDLKIAKNILPLKHSDLAFPYIWLGKTYRSMKDYPNSLNYFAEAIAIREQSLPEEHPLRALAYREAGDVHRLMGNYEKALVFHRKALNIQENVKCSPLECAATYACLGEMYHEMKDYKIAMIYFEKSLHILEERLSKDHPRLAETYHSLSKLYLSTHEYSLAMKNVRQSITIAKKKLSSTHPLLIEYWETFEQILKRM